MRQMVYVVIASQGEYSDRMEWVSGVYAYKESAVEVTKEKLLIAKAAEAERLIWYRKRMAEFPLMNEGHKQIVAAIGECPEGGEADDFTIYAVPMNTWGKWNGFEEVTTLS